MTNAIAVVGLACRFPGAGNPEQFWDLLRNGREARTAFTDDQLRLAGVPEELLRDPAYVKAGMLLAAAEQWDAPFFGVSPRDAAIMDPQHRLFLEIAWEALEHAGHLPQRFNGRIGVFAGCGMDTYLLHNILTNPDLVQAVGMFLVRHTGNDKDFLATRVSYQFDLRGPSVNVLTACSTSLVAIHQAAQSLMIGECDMALAGGVTIVVPQERGYLYKEGEILSPDGHCRAFDEGAKGTVFGSGAGAVLLRRLEDAERDGDTIHAVLVGSAVNNDGARKVSFLAPSVDGYAEVVAEALAMADLSADAVQYIEAHGTGTAVGDPIEIEALTQAFRVTTQRNGFCGIGSVKTNIGHLDSAAGIAGLLKVVLAMQHGVLPASLNFRRPNPLIDFGKSPFRVVTASEPWPAPAAGARIAGVSSLGVGGTNCHLLVRQAGATAAAGAKYPRRFHLLPVAARSEAALRAGCMQLGDWFAQKSDEVLADAAWTLQTGRAPFAVRAIATASNGAEAAAALRQVVAPRTAPERAPSLVFLFPGGGAQHPGMGRGLYRHEPEYRRTADECLQLLPAELRSRLTGLLFGDGETGSATLLERPSLALPALFLTEYAMARTLLAWGLRPDAMLGHSMGEYTAACLASVFTLEQAMQVVRLRAELFEQVAAGAMLSVPMAACDVTALANGDLSLAASNGPRLCAVAGTVAAIERLERALQQRAVECQRVHIQVAAHSHLLEPVLDRFREGLRGMRLQQPQLPFVSNVTGDWIDPARASQPDYWVEHLRHTVRFQEGVATLLQQPRAFVEVGPGRALTSLVRMHPEAKQSALVQAMPHPKDEVPADRVAVEALGRLWQAGVEVDWLAFGGGARRRVPLPTYAFQRSRHWLEPGQPLVHEGVLRPAGGSALPQRLPPTEWFRSVVFRPRPLPQGLPQATAQRWLVAGHGNGLGAAVAKMLGEQGHSVVQVVPSAVDGAHGLAMTDGAAWDGLFAKMAQSGGLPARMCVVLGMDFDDASTTVLALQAMQQAMGKSGTADDCRLLLLTTGASQVAGEAVTHPQQAVATAFGRVVQREYPGTHWRSADVDAATVQDRSGMAALLRGEVEVTDQSLSVAWRNGVRHAAELQILEPAATSPLRQGGVYLITGGLGGVGLALAEHLGRTRQAKLVLVSRRGLPPRELWTDWCRLRPGGPIVQQMERILALEQVGAEVEVIAADVADQAGASAAVRRAHQRFGALHGVFHAAGALDDGPIQVRTPAQAMAVLRPKVQGALCLDQALADQEIDFLALFASVSGLSGIPGQGDYAAANAFLDAFARQRQSKGRRTLAVDWGLFRDAGMVAGLGELRLLPPSEVATDPLLGTAEAVGSGVEFASDWDPRQRWELDEHRLRSGPAVLPGMEFIEIATVAVRAATGAGPVTLRGLELLSPLAFAEDRPRTLFVNLQPAREGLTVVVTSADAGKGAAEHERTTHARLRAMAMPDPGSRAVDVNALQTAIARGSAPVPSHQERFVAFGPRWRCVQRVHAAGTSAVAELQLDPRFQGDLTVHPLHPALLDMAFGCALPLLGAGDGEHLHVPVGCDEARVIGRLPANVLSRVTLRPRETDDRFAVLDVALCSMGGIPLVELHGLQVYGVRGGLPAIAPSSPVPQPAVQRQAPASPLRPRLLALLPRGLSVEEGMPALERALGTDASQVIVSSVDIERAAAWLSLPAEDARRSQPPADAGVELDQPRDDVERALATAFRDLLGVERAGLDQDFFELGGHSLLAVRLFARIHRELGPDLEIATLLSSPTIRKLAVELRGRLSLPEPGSQPVRSVSARKGLHVVPIQTAGKRPPLFLAHGAGGNVLGFRDLSHYLGSDQPLYGLQARGVDGRTPPHGSIEDMARAYLAELREVQPHGPYLLGGYSGGGCIAYEMARQLRAVGEDVAFVGMIDTPSPHMKERGKFARGIIHLRRMLQRGPLYPFRMVRYKLDERRARKQQQALRAKGETMPQDLRGHELQFAFDRAFFAYHVQPYDGEVVLFRAEHESRTKFVRDRELGWSGYPKAVRVVDCPGDHYSMCTEPNVQVLCARMVAEIDRSIARAIAQR